MTSGVFAQASGLSRKALRLYDELGLLHPARVDPETLYRFYDPGQLEQARLVAWLRRLSMPLAVIRSVSGLPPAQAAEELAAYWATVEAETAVRRELAIFLMGYLSGKDPEKDTAMSDGQGTLTVRYGVRSDIGLHREENEDAAYAGARLLAVADGMGGHAAGEVASTAVIDALRPLDIQVPAGELLNALDHAARRADAALRDMVQANPALNGMGTTLTALLWSGSQLGLLHIATRGPTWCATARCSRSPRTTRWCSRCWTRAGSRPKRSRRTRSACCCCARSPAATAPGPISSCARSAPATATCSAPTACTWSCPPKPSPGSCSPWPTPTRPPPTCSPWP